MESINKIQIGTNQYQIGSTVNTDFANALIGGENLLRCTRYPEVTTDTNKIYCSWEYGKFAGTDLEGKISGEYVPYTNIENCPANPEAEPCGALILEGGVGFSQTSNGLVTCMATVFDKFRNTSKGGNTDSTTEISRWPVTFSFYCKSASSSDGEITASPFFEEEREQFTVPFDSWKKVSITRDILSGSTSTLSQYFSKMGFVFNTSSSACYIACPMLTIGEYDVDWKENPLDSKSDIVGIGNILRNSSNLPYGDYWSEGQFLCLISDDFYHVDKARYIGTTTDNLPIPESPDITGKVFGVNAVGNEPAGITQLYNNKVLAEYGQFPKQSALMSLICNSDRVIPVSMSIWCYTPNGKDVRIALMPIRVSDVDLFAPVTYETLSAGEWRRFTRTIYIPANTAMSLNATNIYLGGALAVSDNGAKVYFALPMVTFGSTPSTWFPSAYDIFNEINSVSSSASSALSTAKAAQTTANSASSIASTANSTANSALTTANNKVSKSGDTMTGDLNMSGNGIYDANVIETDVLQTYTHNSINFNCVADVAAYGFGNGETSYTSSQLMQGDGNPRTIETTLTDSDNIPTSSAVKKLKVGGRNLVKGTSNLTIATTSSASAGTFRLFGSAAISTISTTLHGETVAAIQIVNSGSAGGFCQDYFNQYIVGQNYTVSFWAKTNKIGTIKFQAGANGTITKPFGNDISYTFTTTDWEFVSHTFTNYQGQDNNNDSIIYINNAISNSTVIVAHVKIELGDRATDWTPALEDVGCTTDIIDTTGTYTYTDEDGSSYTVPDIKMTGRLSLFSPKKDGTSGGVIQFANYNGSYCYIGQGTIINKKFAPYDSETLCIGAPTINFIGLNNYPNINFSNGTSYYGAHLRNMDKYSVGSATATAYTWTPSTFTTNYGSSNFQYLFGHTATSLTVTIGSSTYFNNNIQYLLIQQTTNTCNITLSGTNVKTKGNITSFTVAAGQSIEFSCLYVNGYNYVTYTIFG